MFESACVKCPFGTYSSSVGAVTISFCLSCRAGTWSRTEGASSNSTCTLCAAGKYSSDPGAVDSSACKDCARGTYSSMLGSPSINDCIKCVRGTYSVTEGATTNSTCVRCVAGKYSLVLGAPSSSSCELCGAGKYSTVVGADSAEECQACPAGKYLTTPGAALPSMCTPCDAGKFSTAVGASVASTCANCEAGKYSTSPGQLTCTSTDSTLSGLPTEAILKLVLVVPQAESEFTADSDNQVAFRQAVANAAGVVLGRVRIVQVVPVSTRLLSHSTRMTIELAVKDRSVADAIFGRLTIDEVNTQLQQAGLPLATYCEISWQGDIALSRPEPDKSNSGALISGIVAFFVGIALIILGGLAYAFLRRSTLVKESGGSPSISATEANLVEDPVPALRAQNKHILVLVVESHEQRREIQGAEREIVHDAVSFLPQDDPQGVRAGLEVDAHRLPGAGGDSQTQKPKSNLSLSLVETMSSDSRSQMLDGNRDAKPYRDV